MVKNASEYVKDHTIWTAEKDIIDHRSNIYNLNRCEIKAWNKLRPEQDATAVPVECPTS